MAVITDTEYPELFLQRMKTQLGSEFDAFVAALNAESPTSVRVNPVKPVIKFNDQEKVSWCNRGFYLEQRPSFTLDPLFHAGTYYVQEASSMFIENIWEQLPVNGKRLRVLDMCAAPGGKSTHLLSLMNKESLLVCNEVIPNRNKVLRENITKWGLANAVITQNDTKDFEPLHNFFDLILIDAPCSGEGMFRKDKTAVQEWSERSVLMCALRQADILKHAVACLKPGGFLIYSTCTFSPDENDLQVERCFNTLDMMNCNIAVKHSNVVVTKYGFQFLPHKTKGEGFYIAVMRKHGDLKSNLPTVANTVTPEPLIKQYLNQPDSFKAYKKNDWLYAIPQGLYADFLALDKHLYIRQAGICMGTQKGKDFLPAHDLAMSIYLNADVQGCNLTYDNAIKFLRSESFKINTDLRGWCMARFEQKNLGWMKLMDGRMNNYYPKDLRILMR